MSTADQDAPFEDETDGVEAEDTTPTDNPKPFDPRQVRVDQKPMSVDLIIRRIKHNEIDLAPAFQRKGGIWKDREQSRLIESLMIRIPIPAFYVDASDEADGAKWVIVDGLQRMTALSRFIVTKELRLCELEFLGRDLNGMTFDELPRAMQRRIEETQLVVYTLEPGTPPEVKFNVFKRINTGGLPLSLQEIRHALNQGPAVQLLEDLADSSEFARATAGSLKHDKRMNDRECVLRFMAFSSGGWLKYRTPNFDYFLSTALKHLNSLSDPDRAKLAERLKRALRAAHAILGRHAFRKLYDAQEKKRRPISKALFEAWTVAFDAFSDEQLAMLVARRDKVLEAFAGLMLTKDFEDAVSAGTGDPKRVNERFRSLHELIAVVLLNTADNEAPHDTA